MINKICVFDSRIISEQKLNFTRKYKIFNTNLKDEGDRNHCNLKKIRLEILTKYTHKSQTKVERSFLFFIF